MVFVNYIYDTVIDAQFKKLHGTVGRSYIYIHTKYTRYYVFLMKDIDTGRSVTPLGATRVNRTILQGRCCCP